MRRFWVDRRFLQGNHFTLQGDLYRHIVRVCRIKKGESFELLAEGVQKYQVRLVSTQSSQGLASIEKTYAVPPLPKPEIHLALSLPRLKTADAVLERVVELGVKAFHPFVSEFSFFKSTASFSEKKYDRWRSIIAAACAQSVRTEPLEIHPLTEFKRLSIPKDAKAWMAYEGLNHIPYFDDEVKLKEVLPSQVWLFIGSEGGFSKQEADFFSQNGGKLFSLGDQILRVETACLMALSLLKYHYHRKTHEGNTKSSPISNQQ